MLTLNEIDGILKYYQHNPKYIFSKIKSYIHELLVLKPLSLFVNSPSQVNCSLFLISIPKKHLIFFSHNIYALQVS